MNESRGEPALPTEFDSVNPIRCYSIIAAAGRSRRMGRPKLLLPWKETTVIDHVLHAWTSSGVDQTIVVIRKDDDLLLEACQRHDVRVIQPANDPADMKESFLCGVDSIDSRTHDWCFFAPADLPTLSGRIIDRMIEHASLLGDESAVVPFFGAKQGHPVVLRQSITARLRQLSPNQGLKTLIDQLNPSVISFPENQRIEDIDTPEEYQSLKRRVNEP